MALTLTDPNGAAQTTTIEYNTDRQEKGSYGRIFRQINPDGSWVRYQYDDQGRKIAKITPWLDAGPNAAETGARAIYYDYAPIDPADSNAAEDTHRLRTVTETIAGQVAAKTF